jgi:hypothetical protein
MSNSRIARLGRSAMLAAALVVPAVSAFADEQYYASPLNPVPELSGQKIRTSDVRVIANTIFPHPELMGFPEEAYAKAQVTTVPSQTAAPVPAK